VKKCLWMALFSALAGILVAGCATPRFPMDKLKLGMTPDEVVQQVGKPYTIRAAKVYEDKRTVEVWEYLPRFFTLYPKAYWVYFEDGQVVQWGEPGDFSGRAGGAVPVGEYTDQKKAY
jgi:hypothetical protein